MNLRTTFVLLVLAAAAGVFLWLDYTGSRLLPLASRPAESTGEGTLDVLKSDLTASAVNRIQVQHGDHQLVLERGAEGKWTLPGKWPTRQAEVEELVNLLTGLRSRFAPRPLTGDLKSYGLEPPPVTVKVMVQERPDGARKEHTLVFGEEPGEGHQFSRATFLRLDDKDEVVRLAPGLLGVLERHQDYYQQRRLFQADKVVKEGDAQEKVEQLAARALDVKGVGSTYTLDKVGDEWQLLKPVHDRPDPDKLKAVLTAVPDIWAEQFVDKPKTDLAEYGLKEPQQTLRVTRPTGETVALLIGKQSQMKTRTVMRPAPSFGGPPMPPQKEVLHDEYRYAKLQDNDQVFEIKADKLKEVFVAVDQLRDARVARFRPEDARRVELSQAGHNIVLVKDKERWRLERPSSGDAETAKVTELLDKLSGLEARDKDVLDKADPKTNGLDKPLATVTVSIEPEAKGDAKAPKPQALTFRLGKHDTDKSKLYVQVAGWERVNVVDDAVLKLVERPALAYRGRHVLDFSTADLAKVEVRRGPERFTLEQVKGSWRLAAPVQADIDGSKASQLAGDLGRLEAVEFVTESPTPKDLTETYGLAKPELTATATFTDANKPPETLVVGKQRAGKPEYYARLLSKPGVFVVKKEFHDLLDQDSLAYRPLQLWQMTADDVKEVRVRKDGPEYHLKRDGPSWKITGPFDAPATAERVRPMTEELGNLRCERYAAHTAKDLKTYGLEPPYLLVGFQEGDRVRLADKPPPKEHVLLIGKPTGKDAKTRFAKLADGDGIFVVGEKFVTAVDVGALDLLDRNLLTLDPRSIEGLRVTGAGTPLALQRQGDVWRVVESPAAPFPADTDTMASVLGVWSNLRAQRFAAYGPKADPAAYGLDKPFATVTVTVQPPGVNGKSGSKPVEHMLALGKPTGGEPGERFARVDGGPGVAVLGPAVVGELTHDYLDFVNHSVLKLDAAGVTQVQRRLGADTLEAVKRANAWRLLKPSDVPADTPTLDALVEELANLHAKRVAAYPAKELKSFGLDDPEAVWTLRLTGNNGKAAEHVVKLGRSVGPDRFALVDNATTVVVLPGRLASRLTAPPLQFHDRNLARITDVDRVVLTRGSRKAVFAKVEGLWKLIAPVEAEAEQTDLEEFLTAVARLRADELVAEKPADLKPYGLDRPEARWEFQSGDKGLTLLVGGREKGDEAGAEGARCYALVAGKDQVFLLTPQLTAKALGEYRSRTVWSSPPDAAQVEGLSYGYAGKPFSLEKVDNDWHVAGKPEAKVKPEAVREALDALAGLKAARFVADKDADLKLYGLEPPQLVLEIRTRAGKQTLHVGRPEGGSKRYYARVPEGNQRAAVFVLGEADAGRVVRPLAAFLQEAGKTSPAVP